MPNRTFKTKFNNRLVFSCQQVVIRDKRRLTAWLLLFIPLVYLSINIFGYGKISSDISFNFYVFMAIAYLLLLVITFISPPLKSINISDIEGFEFKKQLHGPWFLIIKTYQSRKRSVELSKPNKEELEVFLNKNYPDFTKN